MVVYVLYANQKVGKMRILAVDQDQVTLLHLAPLFRTNGIIADSAESAEDALELARHYDYDLILVRWPDWDRLGPRLHAA